MTVIRVVFYWISFMILLFLCGSFLTLLFPKSWSRWVYGISGSLVAWILVGIFLRAEKKSFRDIGLHLTRKSFARFVFGLLTGSLLFGLLLAILVGFSDLELIINPTRIEPAAFFGYVAIIPLALMEEIAFRSYSFIKLEAAVGLRITQVLVAVAFALYHMAGGQSAFTSLLGPGTWAFVFGIAATWSGGIAVPLGIHIALNMLQPLTGMRGGLPSLLVLQYEPGIPEALRKSEGTLGGYLQAGILITGIVLTEIFIRRYRLLGSLHKEVEIRENTGTR